MSRQVADFWTRVDAVFGRDAAGVVGQAGGVS